MGLTTSMLSSNSKLWIRETKFVRRVSLILTVPGKKFLKFHWIFEEISFLTCVDVFQRQNNVNEGFLMKKDDQLLLWCLRYNHVLKNLILKSRQFNQNAFTSKHLDAQNNTPLCAPISFFSHDN
jgi:hypothetical protein